MCVHGKQCVTWVQAMSACVCDTSVCSCIKSKKKPTTSEWRHTSKQQTEVWHKFYKNWAFFFQNRNICRPSTHLYARHGSKQHQQNGRTQTTTTTQRSSEQRRRLNISLFSSQQTKWLPDAVWRQITWAWATETTRLFSVKSFKERFLKESILLH